jgi:D-sedoheptulose 7-phosphate isomerase
MTTVVRATDPQAAFARRDRPIRALATDARALARACHAMACRFHRGGRLIAFGRGPSAADAAHVVVEFVHPVIIGKRALPALALPGLDHAIVVPSDDPRIVREAHVTAYHVLWELVHVFLDAPEVLT